MIEMLNPTLGDAGRFAKETFAFRLAYAKAPQQKATEMAVERFCSPKGRRDFPSMTALKEDAWRYSKMRVAYLQEFQGALIEAVLYSAAYGRLQTHRIALLAPFIDTPHLLKRWQATSNHDCSSLTTQKTSSCR